MFWPGVPYVEALRKARICFTRLSVRAAARASLRPDPPWPSPGRSVRTPFRCSRISAAAGFAFSSDAFDGQEL